MRYPFVITYKLAKYQKFYSFLEKHNDKFMCSFFIIENESDLNTLFNANYQILFTYGIMDEFVININNVLPERIIKNKWLHLDNNEIDNMLDTVENENTVVSMINNLFTTRFVENSIRLREEIRPTFSIFTTCYNSYDKIHRAYNSFLTQKMKDWEWVIVDDSPDDNHFNFLRNNFGKDNRVRLYRRSQNNGSIGNVKNEAISLCRGKYVLEMDHDDEIFPDTLKDATNVFESYNEVGFVYMDYAHLTEKGENYKYGDFFGKGYCGYHCVKSRGKWVYVENTPNINNITMSHLVCMPNHPRIWRRETLMKMGSYCEDLPINDDQEIIMRSAIETKVARISKLGYIQYMNDNNNNFSLIRNAEINRIGPQYLMPMFYKKYNFHEVMKERDAYEDEKYINSYSQIWLRDNYEHKFCNIIINPDCNKQYCIIGIEALVKFKERIDELCKDDKNEFVVLDNRYSPEYLCNLLDHYGYSNFKCYVLNNTPRNILKRYFNLIIKNCEDTEFIEVELPQVDFNTNYGSRHEVINANSKNSDSYLEIGVEYGYTFRNTHFVSKVGVDPDPKINDSKIVLKTSDDYFIYLKETDSNKRFDCIFIDGMHQSEYVLNDFINSLAVLNDEGKIMIDDILPQSYNEQLRIPIKHYYENGILKYGEPWTGDVWKTIYYILLNHNGYISFKYYNHGNYRGVGVFHIKEEFEIIRDDKKIDDIIKEIQNYDYLNDFHKYVELVKTLSTGV